MTTFRNPLADPLGTRRGPPLVRGPQFENRCAKRNTTHLLNTLTMLFFFVLHYNRGLNRKSTSCASSTVKKVE